MSDDQNNTIAAINTDVYYSGQYWNDYSEVVAEVQRRISGDATLSWQRYFQKSQQGRRFHKALILNCGNGWVERELFQLGMFDEAVGVDIAEDLLQDARSKAGDMPLRYSAMDINSGAFPEYGFDLVVNHAAAHHMAYLDRIFRNINRVMTRDGVMVNYDYVGPHRNQYPFEQWSAAYFLNEKLPWYFQQDMQYPHLPTMLATDPSEAIHAELILTTMRRYFDISDYHALGGAIAYLLLTHNAAARQVSLDRAGPLIAQILSEDSAYLAEHPESSLFAYWVARPRALDPDDSPWLKTFEAEENEREVQAKRNSGYYYPLSLIQVLYMQLSDARAQVQALQGRLGTCE